MVVWRLKYCIEDQFPRLLRRIRFGIPLPFLSAALAPADAASWPVSQPFQMLVQVLYEESVHDEAVADAAWALQEERLPVHAQFGDHRVVYDPPDTQRQGVIQLQSHD